MGPTFTDDVQYLYIHHLLGDKQQGTTVGFLPCFQTSLKPLEYQNRTEDAEQEGVFGLLEAELFIPSFPPKKKAYSKSRGLAFQTICVQSGCQPARFLLMPMLCPTFSLTGCNCRSLGQKQHLLKKHSISQNHFVTLSFHNSQRRRSYAEFGVGWGRGMKITS